MFQKKLRKNILKKFCEYAGSISFSCFEFFQPTFFADQKLLSDRNLGCRDTQHYDTQHNDTKHNAIQYDNK